MDDSESIKPIVETQDTNKSLLLWDPDIIAYLDKACVPGADTLQRKQLTAASYLHETCYELALCPEDNVSQSQGAEALMGKSCRE
jgi:hypothetical protein